MGKTGAERLRESRERKKQKKREYNARFYVKNKDKILKDRKEERRKKRPRIVVEQERERKAPKPNWRLYKAKQRARKKAENEKKASTNVHVSPNAVRRGAFPNRTSRKRAVDTTRTYLPSSPRKKVAVIASLVESPTTQHTLQRLGYLNSPENREDERMAPAILEDAKTALQATKRKRSNDARAATHVSLSVLSAKRGLALSPEIMIEKQL